MVTQTAAQKAATNKIAEIKKETKSKMDQVRASYSSALKGATTQQQAAIKAANDSHKANVARIRQSLKDTKTSLMAQRDSQAQTIRNQEDDAIAYVEQHGVVGL